jgi:hypothetical protein
MKRLLILAFLSLSLLSFDWGFPRDMWKPVNTALGFYYSLTDPEYNYIAWDLLTDDWKNYQGLERNTFVQEYESEKKIVDIIAGVEMPPDYYKIILMFDDNTGMILCVRNDHGHWEIDCIWSE